MNRLASVLIAVVLVVLSLSSTSVFARKQIVNVHIALTGVGGEMVVSWKASDNTSNPQVRYGTSSGSYSNTVNAYSITSYASRAGFNYNALITHLSASTTYYYICGDASYAFSSEFNFTTPSANVHAFNAAIYGDLGTDNSQNTVNRLNARSAGGLIDMFWHLGDISYANDHPLEYESTWDKWFSVMEPSMAHIPYMVLPGNHESWSRNLEGLETKNFTTYIEKFRMPGPESGSNTNMFWSIDYMNMHFISVSTETDFPGAPIRDPSPKQQPLTEREAKEYFQVNWLIADLEKAQANRKNVPWIVVGGHRPVYCATSNEQRNGVPIREASSVQAWLEPLFKQYGVDIYFSGHAHLYSRTYPTYRNQPTQKNFTNPQDTVYVVSGGAGNREGLEKLSDPQPSWAAGGYDQQYGYGIATVYNNTHLTWNYYRADTDEIVDSFTLIKESHP